jgi:hypothetical protein
MIEEGDYSQGESKIKVNFESAFPTMDTIHIEAYQSNPKWKLFRLNSIKLYHKPIVNLCTQTNVESKESNQ